MVGEHEEKDQGCSQCVLFDVLRASLVLQLFASVRVQENLTLNVQLKIEGDPDNQGRQYHSTQKSAVIHERENNDQMVNRVIVVLRSVQFEQVRVQLVSESQVCKQ